MHIVYVTSELSEKNLPSKGGLASFVANISSIMKTKGHKVSVILVTTKEENRAYNIDVPVFNVFVPKEEWDEYDAVTKMLYPNSIEECDTNRKIIVDIRKSELVKKKIKEIDYVDKIDIVHFANLGGYSLVMDYSIPYVVRISGYGNICEEGAAKINGSIEFTDNPIRPKDVIEIRALKRAPFTISPSKLCAEIGKNGLGLNPKVIESPYYPYDEKNLEIYNSVLKGKDYILFYGKMTINKGIHIISEIADNFLENNPNMYIVMAGSDRYITIDGNTLLGSEYVYSKVEKHKERIIYLGQVSRENLQGIISKAKLVVLPSRMDNLPNTCIESMAQGQIVVGTEGASYEQLIVNKENGFLAERDNAESFLQAINLALELSEDEKIRVKKAAKNTIERLSPEKIYEQYISYYSFIIKDWENLILEKKTGI